MAHPYENQFPADQTRPNPPEEVDYNDLDQTEESLNAAEMTRHGRAADQTRKRGRPTATQRRAEIEEDPDNPSNAFSD